MKLNIVLVSAMVLQGCAVGALMDSNIEMQPIFKTPDAAKASADVSNRAVSVHQAVDNTVEQAQAGSDNLRMILEPTSAQTPIIQENVNEPAHAVKSVVTTTSNQLVAPTTTTTSANQIYLQVGMFTSIAGAQQVKANAQAATSVPVNIRNKENKEFRVLVGPIPPSQLKAVEQQLNAANFSYFRFAR